jgi:hypothetical protein
MVTSKVGMSKSEYCSSYIRMSIANTQQWLLSTTLMLSLTRGLILLRVVRSGVRGLPAVIPNP